MQQRNLWLGSKICGKLVQIAGAAWIAGKAIFPQLSESLTPKHPLTWLKVKCF